MKIPHPLISVIIPTHLRSHLLLRALTSINNQMHRELIEVIVVSDKIDLETDNVCCQLLKANDFYIRRGGKPGPSTSRNIGLSVAHGSYIMFLDDDDTWADSFLDNLLPIISNHKNNFLYFNCNVITENRGSTPPKQLEQMFLNQEDKLTIDVFTKNQIHMSCYLFPYSLVSNIQFDQYMRAYEDWDFLLSVFEKEMPAYLNITSSNIYEVHDNTSDRRGSSADAQNFNAVIDYLYVYRRHPSPTPEIQSNRKMLLQSVNLTLPDYVL